MECKNQTKAYIIIVLLLSWLVQYVLFTGMLPGSFLILYMFVPAILAFFFYFRSKNPWKTQLALFTRGVSLKAVLFAIFYPFLLLSLATLGGFATGLGKLNPHFPETYLTSKYFFIFLVSVVMAFPTMFGEEYGWRGYLLPALTKTKGKIVATIIVGIVWGLWHLPSYYIVYNKLDMGNPILLTAFGMIIVMLGSFPLSYCFYLTGNILPCVLYHAMYDLTVPIFFGNPKIANLQEGTAGLLEIAWPMAMLFIFLAECIFAIIFIKLFKKMKENYTTPKP